MDIIGYVAAIFIGVLLGLLGGGGSILTVPVLVYLLGIDAVLATGYSLFIVGFTSAVGGVRAYIQKLVDFRAVSLFGLPSILTIFISRQFILPAIPDNLFYIGKIEVDKGSFLMIIFAVLMLFASISMFRSLKEPKVINDGEVHQYRPLSLLIPGLLVGLATGLLGAGGGFLIVPSLVLLLRLPIKIAVGTSLFIIAINSIFGFVFSIGRYHFHWELLLIFTALACVGVFAGSYLSQRLNAITIKRIFGWFILLMAIYVLTKELLLD
ncbi:MAG: sulfite exporter TauE/SafE family protein [Chitinophagaceae bacterium]|nr:sulfite exporter TauE/SafE family protein [Chitinophagaceae bacterium]